MVVWPIQCMHIGQSDWKIQGIVHEFQNACKLATVFETTQIICGTVVLSRVFDEGQRAVIYGVTCFMTVNGSTMTSLIWLNLMNCSEYRIVLCLRKL